MNSLQSQSSPKSDVSDKQTLLAVLQFLKKNNLKVDQSIYLDQLRI